jgi:hypothetical protein
MQGQNAHLITGMESDYLFYIHHGLPLEIALQVEVAHSHLTKVTRMIFVQVGPVVMLTTGKTTLGVSVSSGLRSSFSATYTSGMLAMFAYASMSSTDMSSVLSSLAQVSRMLATTGRAVGAESQKFSV